MHKQPPRRIACLGEAMIELSLSATGNLATVGFAGDTLNTAIYLKRSLAPKDVVSFVSVLGTDALSDQMINFIKAENISVNHISRIDERVPGLYAISTDASGERSFNYWRDTSAARRLFQTEGPASFQELSNFDVVFLTGITLAIMDVPVREQFFTWLLRYKKMGNKTIVFDSNYRSKLWANVAMAKKNISRAWSLTDIGLPSVDDEMTLFGDSSADAVKTRLNTWGVTTGVLKCGSAGPVSLGQPVELGDLEPITEVVDSTAAGDSFNGAFLGSYLQQKSLAESIMDGHQCACNVIGHAGAIIPQITES